VDIAVWLRGLGLQQYEPMFGDNDIDGAVLPSLTAEDLKDLGITSVGHRRRLLEAITALGAGGKLAAVAPGADVSPVAEAERRQLTVMFCDLAASTELSARLDPEDFRELLGDYHAAVREEIKRFDGFIAKYMGDGVLIYFGYPQAHEDDVERAVRAGLGLARGIARIKAGAAYLASRIGIATGLVVVGDLIGSGEAQERGVVGDTPNLAARLQGLAEPNTVLIDKGTRTLLGNLFEYHDLDAVEIKGFPEPVKVWRVLRPSAVASRFEALRAVRLTPLIGRDDEIELLMRRWSRAKEGEGQIVLLAGEPGVAKSRVAAAISERLGSEPHRRLRYFCSPQHCDSPLYPFITHLERAASFTHEDPPELKLEKLDALLARSGESPAQTAALFADLLELPAGSRYPPPPGDPQRRRELTFAAMLDQLRRLARRKRCF
jgi:class 3 adenylate cyclase